MADAYTPIGEGQQQQTGYDPIWDMFPLVVQWIVLWRLWRRGFVKKVRVTLAAQLLVTARIALSFQSLSQQELQGEAWMLPMSMFLCLACSIMACQDVPSLARKSLMRYCMLLLFTLAEGVMVGSVVACYSATGWLPKHVHGRYGMYGSDQIAKAGAVAWCALIFVCRSIEAWTTDVDLIHISKDQSRIQTIAYLSAWKLSTDLPLVYACCSILAFVNYGLHHYIMDLRNKDEAR